jgi:hypothetical protein
VVALPREDASLARASGALMVVAVPEETARELAAAGARSFLSVVVVR